MNTIKTLETKEYANIRTGSKERDYFLEHIYVQNPKDSVSVLLFIETTQQKMFQMYNENERKFNRIMDLKRFNLSAA